MLKGDYFLDFTVVAYKKKFPIGHFLSSLVMEPNLPLKLAAMYWLDENLPTFCPHLSQLGDINFCRGV